MPLVSRTRATLRSAEFGFFGVWVYTRVQTPRFCGQDCRAGLAVLYFGACPSLAHQLIECRHSFQLLDSFAGFERARLHSSIFYKRLQPHLPQPYIAQRHDFLSLKTRADFRPRGNNKTSRHPAAISRCTGRPTRHTPRSAISSQLWVWTAIRGPHRPICPYFPTTAGEHSVRSD